MTATARIVTLLLAVMSADTAAQTDDLVRTENELGNIRNRISSVQEELESSQKQYQALSGELRSKEQAAGRLSDKLKKLKQALDLKISQVQSFHNEQRDLKRELRQQQDQLASYARVTYLSGRGNLLKLLLNQENPDATGRMLAYYDYYNRDLAEHVQQTSVILNGIKNLQSLIAKEIEEIRVLEKNYLNEVDQYLSFRKSRGEILKKLKNYMRKQGTALRILQGDEKSLIELIEKLKGFINKEEKDIAFFDTLEGQLAWPVRGTFSNRYGEPRKGGIMTWDGVTILTEEGSEVQAISNGRVIFSDWFQNLGQLIILDHGHGYMSLYGHNQSLAKDTGEWVNGGELIARAGDTGGREQTGLYFEIRRHGVPVDPAFWCVRK